MRMIRRAAILWAGLALAWGAGSAQAVTGLDGRWYPSYRPEVVRWVQQILKGWNVYPGEPTGKLDQATAGLTYQPVEPVRLNLDYRFVGARNNDAVNSPEQRQGSFGVVNVSASYDMTKQWQLFGRIDNVFNQQYEEILFFGTPIRSVFGGVKFTY